MDMPTFDQMMQPTLQALANLGGSGRIEEITEQVIQIMDLPAEVTSQMHNVEKSSRTEVEYRLAWSRTYLKKYGLLNNSERGVWSFTEKYTPNMIVNPAEVSQFVRAQSTVERAGNLGATDDDEENEGSEDGTEQGWRDILRDELLNLSPDAFERLAQRLLREIGFVQVDVLGRSGDGGIDGKGIVKIQKILSYHVFFQCKRYQSSVGAGDMRDFRGAIVGRGDRGLFITTSGFTSEARKEATRDGAPPIDLIDGDTLLDLLKEFRLGIEVRMVEEVDVKREWFEGI